jgi:hypothetical protein
MTPVVNAQSIAAIAFVAREEFACDRAIQGMQRNKTGATVISASRKTPQRSG